MIYKYGNNINVGAQHKAFVDQVVQPTAQDRAGAAAEAAHQDMIAQLRARHGTTYESAEINWRLWANYILGLDGQLQAQAINNGPPSRYAHLFRCYPAQS